MSGSLSFCVFVSSSLPRYNCSFLLLLLLTQQNTIPSLLLFIQLQSSVLQPPLTEEHKQRARNIMESLNPQTPAESCSTSLPSNVLYPSSKVKLMHTHPDRHRLVGCVYYADTYTLTYIWTAARTLQKPQTCICCKNRSIYTRSQHPMKDTDTVLYFKYLKHLYWFSLAVYLMSVLCFSRYLFKSVLYMAK